MDIERALTEAGQHIAQLLDQCDSFPARAHEDAHGALLRAANFLLRAQQALAQGDGEGAWGLVWAAHLWINNASLTLAVRYRSPAAFHRDQAAERVLWVLSQELYA